MEFGILRRSDQTEGVMGAASDAFPEILELLYEGLVSPERWSDFLAELSRRTSCDWAAVAFHDAENRNPVAPVSFGVSAKILEEFNGYFGNRNPLALRVLREALRGGYYLSAKSLCQAPAVLRESEYGQWQERHDISHSIVAAMPNGRESAVSINLIRTQSAGAFSDEAVELVRLLIPHFARAFQVHRKLEDLRAFSEAGMLALNRLDAAFAAVDGDGRVVLMNEQAEAILRRGHGITIRDGKLATMDASESSRLDRLVKSAARTGAGRGSDSGGAILVQRLSIIVTPFFSSRLLSPVQPHALVFISDPQARPVSRAALLRGLFGLTPAECRLAQLLLEGMELHSSSDRLGITASTARFMLKSIFHKTACHRQAQLVRLLSLLPGEPRTSGQSPSAGGFAHHR